MNEQRKMLEAYMARRLNSFVRDPNESRVRATLANLRRGIGRKPGEMPELWGLLFADMPEALMSRNGEPTRAEWAAYTALTLYALHQQGKSIRDKNMHTTEEFGRLGRAVGRLVTNDDERERVARRFNAFATANDMQEAAHYLRGLVQLLKAEDFPLDYIRLASDLYSFQNPNFVSSVRLTWGQDFYRMKQDDNTMNDAEKGQEDDHA